MNFLSWGSQRSPLCRSKRVASSPSSPPEGGELSAQGCQASHTGRPRRFSRPRRFAPHHTMQVCCILLPAVGFATFPGIAADSLRCKHRFVPSAPPFPSGARPFEVFPSTTAPVTSPRPVSLSLFQLASFPFARRKRRALVPSACQPTSGLCSAAESVAVRRRCRQHTARYSHGLRTIKVVHVRRGRPRCGPTPASSRCSQVSSSWPP
jgi:hypothetical protein